MTLSQGAAAPVTQELHKNEPAPVVARHWSPEAVQIDLSASDCSWMTCGAGPDLAPTPEFVTAIHQMTLMGKAAVISVPEEQPATEPGAFGSTQLAFHQQLAADLSGRVLAYTGDCSYHSARMGPESAEGLTGFQTTFAKVLPPHYDLGLYTGGEQGQIYKPAHISLTAWGGRGADRQTVTIDFFDLNSYLKAGGELSEGVLDNSATPAIYCLNRNDAINAVQGAPFRFSAEIPADAITVIPSKGLAHGTQYQTYDSGIALNTALKRQELGTDPPNKDLMTPIDVLIL